MQILNGRKAPESLGLTFEPRLLGGLKKGRTSNSSSIAASRNTLAIDQYMALHYLVGCAVIASWPLLSNSLGRTSWINFIKQYLLSLMLTASRFLLVNFLYIRSKNTNFASKFSIGSYQWRATAARNMTVMNLLLLFVNCRVAFDQYFVRKKKDEEC